MSNLHGKYAIQEDSSEKWLSLDFSTGAELIYVKSFLSAIPFNSIDEAKEFIKFHNKSLEGHTVFWLQLSAQPKRWN